MAYYPITYQFKDTLVGSYRLMGGTDSITVRLSSQAPTTGQRNSTFTVLLQRNIAAVGYSTVGTASFPRNGMKEVKFPDLPSGLYRLRFEKSTDGIEVTGVGVYYD